MKILRPGDPRDVMAAKMEIQKEDVFHFKALVEYMHDYLEEEHWHDTFKPKPRDKIEHYYLEDRKQNGTREHRLWWRMEMNPWGSKYYRYILLVNMRNIYAKKVEVVHKGQKFSTWRGNLTLLIESWIQTDFENKWVDHWAIKHLEELYRMRIWKSQLDKLKKDLWYETYKFAAFIKQFLEMKNPFEIPEAFHPVMQGMEPGVPFTGRKDEFLRDMEEHEKPYSWGD